MVLIDGRDGDDTISLTPAVSLPSQVYGEGETIDSAARGSRRGIRRRWE